MGSEFTPVFLLLIVAIGIAASMLIGRRFACAQEADAGQADAL